MLAALLGEPTGSPEVLKVPTNDVSVSPAPVAPRLHNVELRKGLRRFYCGAMASFVSSGARRAREGGGIETGRAPAWETAGGHAEDPRARGHGQVLYALSVLPSPRIIKDAWMPILGYRATLSPCASCCRRGSSPWKCRDCCTEKPLSPTRWVAESAITSSWDGVG